MSEHLVRNQIENYCRRKLSAAELLLVSDHLDACELCRRQLERALDGDADFPALRTQLFDEAQGRLSAAAGTGHLAYEQITAYIEGASAGEELQAIRDHLSGCDECTLAVNDLQAFRNQIGPDLGHEVRPMPGRTSREGWWRRSIAFLTSPFAGNRAFGFASVAAAVILMWGGWSIWRTVRESEPMPAAVRIPSPAPLPTPGPPAAVIARLNDARGQVSLDREGTLSGVDYLPPAYRLIVKQGMTDQRIEKPSVLTELNRPGSLLMGGAEPANQFSPADPVGKMVLSDRPALRWSQLKGATAYVVEIYDEKFNPVSASPRLAKNSWTVTRPLRRSATYSWQVTAFKDGTGIKAPRPPAPQAQFRVLDQAQADEIIRARKDYAGSHLLLGLLYARAGLLDEAEAELKALLSRNPDSAIVRGLLASVDAMRR